jgi:hypothetical protein
MFVFFTENSSTIITFIDMCDIAGRTIARILLEFAAHASSELECEFNGNASEQASERVNVRVDMRVNV